MTKIALITGGSSGLGFCFAQILGKEGYHIIILARDNAKIDETVKGLKKDGISASGYSCDITKEVDLRNTAEKIKAEFTNIDFLILNAGVVTVKLLQDYIDSADLRKDLDIDLWGTMLSAWLFLPFLKEGSKILMTSSGFGLMGGAGYTSYCAAKAGIINFAESLRRELLYKKINVYVSCPGDLDTPQFHNEVKQQPDWMKNSPRKLAPPFKTAKYILSKCKGSARFLIITGADVKLLSITTRLLPRPWRDYLLDKTMPRPK